MKVLSLDASKYKLKWALFQLPLGEELASGLIESIGKKESLRRLHWRTLNDTKKIDIPNFECAVQLILNDLIAFSVIDSIDEIEAIGHRILEGGEYSKESTIVFCEKGEKLTNLSDYTLMNNSFQMEIIRIFQRLTPQMVNVAVVDTVIYRQAKMSSNRSIINQVAVNKRPFIQRISDYVQDGRIIAAEVYRILGERVRV